MLIKSFATIISAKSAFAAPLICTHKGVGDLVRPLVEHVRSYEAVDRRAELDKFEDAELTEDERSQIKAAVGKFICPAEPGRAGTISSAFIFERSDEVVTAAHAYGSPARRRDLTKCYFENFENPPQRRYLAASSDRNVIPYGVVAKKGSGFRDRARAKLASPIKNARPFLGEKTDDPPDPGQNGYAVMAQNVDISLNSASSPLITRCQVKFLDAEAGRAWLNTDCDADEGGSGGVFLVRNENGLIARGVIDGVSSVLRRNKIPNHTPYDPDKNNTRAVLITPDLFSK